MIENSAEDSEVRKQLRKLLKEAFAEHTEAEKFVNAYCVYSHKLDDLIDNEVKNPVAILEVFWLAEQIYSSDFYHANREYLYPIIQLIGNEYHDSVVMERSDVEWKRKHADVLCHCGNNLLIAILVKIVSYERLREISLLLRENAYELHTDKDGNRI